VNIIVWVVSRSGAS